MNPSPADAVCLFLCGDVMTGRGIDQILPYPAPPVLYEPYVRDARDYVQLAEDSHGRIPRAADFAYIWGDALAELQRSQPDARIINLETSITLSEMPWPDKGINYRMNPKNIGCLTAAGIDCCCLANNHVLDWGYDGLAETLETLDAAGISHAGAGRNAQQAASPAVLHVGSWGRVLVFAFGTTTSGIPPDWRATERHPGVNVLEDLSDNTAVRIGAEIRAHKESHDLAVVSIHWGGNWGYDISARQIDFAHRLIGEGVDLVHGHSSHHVRAAEVYHDRLVLYGCGDFITDYEGITGYEEFRGDLALMYLAKVESQSGRLLEARLLPMQSRRFRLQRASGKDAKWLCARMNELGTPFGTHARLESDNSIRLFW